MLDQAIPAIENPDALAGAIGADVQGTNFDNQFSADRNPAAAAYVAFGRAVADLPPEGRMIALERAFEVMRAGEPIPALINIMAEARDWAAWASRSELKAYALASFERLTLADRTAFLSHVSGRAAA